MRNRVLLALAGVAFLAVAGFAQRTDVFVESRDHPAIAYGSTPATDPIAQLNHKLEEGTASLTFDPANGYLRSVLDALDLPIESQSVVFSQTSFQAPLIDMRNPRALYFNDTVMVGWVRARQCWNSLPRIARRGRSSILLIRKRRPRRGSRATTSAWRAT